MLDRARLGLPWAVALGMLGSTAGHVIAEVEEKPWAHQSALQFQHRLVDEQPPRNPWMKLACDFEARTPDYAWFGPPETNNVPR